MVNCRKSLTVCLLAVLIASCFAVFSVQPVAAYTGTITYSAATNTVTAVGGTASVPITFNDLYLAVGNSSLIALQGTNQYILYCKLYVGDGSTLTYFADTNKMIVFSNGLGNNFLRVQTNATFTLGVLNDLTTFRTSQGCTLCYYDTLNSRGQFTGSGSVNFYGCYIYSNNQGAYQGLSLYAIGNLTLYNCILSRTLVQEANTNTKIFNAQFMKPPFGAVIFTGSPALFSKVSVTDSGESVIYSYRNVTALNPYGRNCVYTAYLNANNHNISINLVNPDIDNRHFFFTGAYVAGSRVNEQYEFDLTVLNGEITEFVNEANVTLTKGGVVVGSWLTNSSGQIDSQVLTYGYYAKATGDTLQGGADPFVLTVSHPDWADYTSRFYVTEKTKMTISMQESGGASDSDEWFVVGGILGCIFAAVVVAAVFMSKRR